MHVQQTWVRAILKFAPNVFSLWIISGPLLDWSAYLRSTLLVTLAMRSRTYKACMQTRTIVFPGTTLWFTSSSHSGDKTPDEALSLWC
jgi:hypothetical protein